VTDQANDYRINGSHHQMSLSVIQPPAHHVFNYRPTETSLDVTNI